MRCRRLLGAGLAALAAALGLAALAGLAAGSLAVSPAAVLRALHAPDGSAASLVVATIRLPRVLAAVLAGSALAVAGAIMQGITHNPLASPGLLGINAGAAFAVVLATTLFGAGSVAAYAWYAMLGAAAAAAVVYALGSAGRAGATPLRLALAGAVVGSFLASLTAAILIADESTLDSVRLWTAGSLAGRSMAMVGGILPYVAAGHAVALLWSRQITTLSLGPEVARGLGQNAALARGVSALIVVVLAGSAVALAGPVGFVGLIAPHAVRLVAGHDYRWVIPYSALAGALLVVVADTVSRIAIPGQDIPVGVTMALIGGPFFVHLVRRRMASA